MGNALRVFLKLVEAVEDLGGSDADLRRIETNSDLRQELAQRIVRERLITGTFPVSLDYSVTLASLIQAGRYDRVNENINAQNFPATGVGRIETEIVLFHFNQNMSSEAANCELDQRGYRPATAWELLAFGARYPEEQRKGPIVALGSLRRFPIEIRAVPYLYYGDADGRGLTLASFDGGWGSACRFAAVRK